MTSLTVEELQQILDTTGLTKNALEKKFGMGQGSIGKFMTGKLNGLPDKYVAKIRKLGNNADNLVKDESKNNTAKIYIDEAEVPFIEEPLDKKLEGLIPEVKYLNERDNPLINAARGRDENGINNDELKIDLGAIERISCESKTELTDKDYKDCFGVPKPKQYKRPLIDKNLLP